MSEGPKEVLQEWIGNGIKSLVFCVFAMFTFFVHQLNDSIGKLTEQLHTIEAHQIEADKRIAAIEVSRQVSMVGYEKLQSDVQDMKTQLIQMVARTQTIADFIATNFNNPKKHP